MSWWWAWRVVSRNLVFQCLGFLGYDTRDSNAKEPLTQLQGLKFPEYPTGYPVEAQDQECATHAWWTVWHWGAILYIYTSQDALEYLCAPARRRTSRHDNRFIIFPLFVVFTLPFLISFRYHKLLGCSSVQSARGYRSDLLDFHEAKLFQRPMNMHPCYLHGWHNPSASEASCRLCRDCGAEQDSASRLRAGSCLPFVVRRSNWHSLPTNMRPFPLA